MIFSALKGFFVLIFVGILGLLAGYLNDTPGGVNLVFYSEEFRFSFLSAIFFLLIIIVAILILIKILNFLSAVLSFFRGDETAIKRFFERSKERRGLKAFSNSLIALEEGENDKAFSEAKKAEKLLRFPQMTALLGARATRANGLISSEKEYNKKLLKYPETQIVGLRGLINSSLEDGDIDTALALAEKAKKLNPKNVGVTETLFNLQCKNQDWEGAHKSVSEMFRQKQSLTGEELRRRESVVLTAAAKENQLNGLTEKSLSLARQAVKKTPEFIPAIIVCAELEHLVGKKSSGVKLIKSAWAVAPHPLLASVYANFFPEETPENRLDRFQSLLRNLKHLEAAIISANLHIAIEDFPKARSVLVPFTEAELDSRVATLMAAAEKGCGEDEKVVSGWLSKSTTSKRPPEWICDRCGYIDSWRPVCSKCDTFDSQIWASPSNSTELHHGLTTLPFVLDSSEVKPEKDTGHISDDIEGDLAHEEREVDSNSEVAPDLSSEEENETKGKDRRKEKQTIDIADNARKII